MDVLKLKGKRVEKGFTQETIAEKANMSAVSYCRKERGEREFLCSEISAITIMLSLSPEEVYDIFLK